MGHHKNKIGNVAVALDNVCGDKQEHSSVRGGKRRGKSISQAKKKRNQEKPNQCFAPNVGTFHRDRSL